MEVFEMQVQVDPCTKIDELVDPDETSLISLTKVRFLPFDTYSPLPKYVPVP